MLASLLLTLALCAQPDVSAPAAAVPSAAPQPTETAAPPGPRLPLESPVFTARFTASDAGLQSAWQHAALSIGRRREEGFASEIVAPVGPFWGDMALMGHAYLWYTGDASVLRAGIERIFYPSPVPEDEGTQRPLAAYSLLWPQMLHTYYLHTGDADYARALAAYALPELMAHFGAALGANGLLDASRLPAWPQDLLAGFPPEAAAAPNAVLNAFYYHALATMKTLAAEVGLPSSDYAAAAAKAQAAFDAAFWDADAKLYRDAPGLATHSVLSNALALDFGLVPADRREAILALLRRDGANCADRFRPYVIEACFRAGQIRLGCDLLAFAQDAAWDASALSLIPQYIGGLGPADFGWRGVQAVPRVPSGLDEMSLSFPIPQGRISMHYARATGVRLLLPPGTGAWVEGEIGGPIMTRNEISHGRGELAAEQWTLLQSKEWAARAGAGLGVWVSVGEQMLRVIQDGRLVYQARCASSASGVGSEANSMKTPLGWHKLVTKLGEGAVRGQVFRSRRATHEVWQPGEQPAEDLVLTRVLLLDGLEPGLNKGGNVDSYARNIYIHGTNDETRLGTPSSHGCIRLSNDDVVEVFDLLSESTPVLITAE